MSVINSPTRCSCSHCSSVACLCLLIGWNRWHQSRQTSFFLITFLIFCNCFDSNWPSGISIALLLAVLQDNVTRRCSHLVSRRDSAAAQSVQQSKPFPYIVFKAFLHNSWFPPCSQRIRTSGFVQWDYEASHMASNMAVNLSFEAALSFSHHRHIDHYNLSYCNQK